MKNKAAKALSTVDPHMPPKDGSVGDYEAENHYDNLTRMHGVMSDEPMMERVRKVAGRKVKAATGLNEMLNPPVKEKPPMTIKRMKQIRTDLATKRRLGTA